MTVRRLSGKIKKITINLYERDVERMKELYPTITYQAAIRELVKAYVADVDAKRARLLEGVVSELDV